MMTGAKVPFPVEFWDEMVGWPIGEQFMAAYVLTSKRAVQYGRVGLFPLTPAEIDHAQPEWTLRRIERALTGLEARGWLVRADGWMFVARLIEISHPRGRDQIAGAIRRLELAPRHSIIWVSFMNAVSVRAPEFASELARQAQACPPTRGSRDPLGTLSADPLRPIMTGTHVPRREGLERVPQTLSRLEGTPESVRDTTASGPRAGGHTASSAAEPHGNTAGGERP